VQAILDGMEWLGLSTTKARSTRCSAWTATAKSSSQMLEAGTPTLLLSPEEVEAMRERMRAAGEKPRYDGTWRPEPGKTLPASPEGRKPVVRFKNPLDGEVSWDDVVKGTITIGNKELDDLVIARPRRHPDL
jgi:glutamyl-tRNA synthetase